MQFLELSPIFLGLVCGLAGKSTGTRPLWLAIFLGFICALLGGELSHGVFVALTALAIDMVSAAFACVASGFVFYLFRMARSGAHPEKYSE